ncbi:MAG: hypothetical protein KDD44_04040 [Bdellovibrionales bacterium]|nr:hypothetical protein [Bdellovibrionales bacterium]
MEVRQAHLRPAALGAGAERILQLAVARIAYVLCAIMRVSAAEPVHLPTSGTRRPLRSHLLIAGIANAAVTVGSVVG